jgi:bacterioferritin-associated ferredoxin
MNIQDLPAGLLQTSKKIVETQDVLESCASCGAVVGSCLHTEGQVLEDTLSEPNVPAEDEPEDKLSGNVEDVEVNPEYKTSSTIRRP